MRKLLTRITNIIRRYSSTIRVQLIAGIILIIAIPSTCSIYYLYTRTNKTLTRNYEQLNLEQFHQLASNVGNMLNEADKINVLLGNNPALQTVLEYPDLTNSADIEVSKNMFDTMNQFFNSHSYIASIYCYSNNNIILGVDVSSNTLLHNYFPAESDSISITYNSDIFRSISSRTNSLMSIGGLTRQNFSYPTNRYTRNDRYITLIKSLTLKYNIILLINIKEEAFRSIYNDNSNPNNLTYITNSKGVIVSHPDAAKISNFSPAFSEDMKQGDSGSYIYDDGSDGSIRTQVVYYRIKGTDFLLVRETPLKMIINDTETLKQLFIITLSLSIIFTVILSMFFIRKITNPLVTLTHSMRQIEKGKLEQAIHHFPNNEIGVLNRQFNKMSASIIELIEKNKAIEEERHNMELEALQAQINPHFLFNTLNTLKWMALITNATKVAEGLTALGNLLHPLYSHKGAMWTIREEYAFVQDYLKLMNYRFGGKCKMIFSFQEEIMDYMILTFILQPILENSFIHGLNNQNNLSEISVLAFEREESILFELKDNGVGIDKEELSRIRSSFETDRSLYGKGGIGISNVSRRMQLYFGDKCGIKIESIPGTGTTVFVHIPKIYKDNEM